MFDLFRSREKTVRILLGGLLLLVALSMLTYLVPSYNTGAGNANDTIVAEVAGTEITLPDVQRLIQATMRGKQLPPDILSNYIPQMVEQMVTDRAMAYEATRLGYQVSDAELSAAIRQMLPSLFPDGKFVGRDAYAAMLAQENMTIPEFEADLRRQILVTRLRDVAIEGSIVTPIEIEVMYKKRNEKIKVEYVKLTSDKYKSEVNPSEADMQSYFKVNASRYQIPEKKNLTLLIADQAKIEQSVNATDADLRKMYTQNQESFRTPERVQVRHILLKTQGKPAGDEAKIKAQAEDILKQVKAGGNFGELVKKYSEDTASVQTGGEYWVQRNGQMVPEFEKAAFSLKPGESDLIKTTYGYHIIQVMKHEQAHLQTFEEVKGQIATEWKKQRVNDLIQQISDRAQGQLQKDYTQADKVAAAFNMQLVHADGVEAGQPVPEIGTNADFDQSIADLKKGQVSQPVALPGNKIVLAAVTEVTAPRPARFDEVQSKVRDAMVQERLAKAVQDHAQEFLSLAKSNGGDLAKAAKAMGLEVKTSEAFARSGSVTGIGSASYLQEGFSRADGAVFGPIPLPDGTIVAKVVEHVPADMSQLAAQRTSIRDDLKSQKARSRNTLFEAGLRDALIKEGKIKIHKDVVNRLIAGFRNS
jgi:peptidyl-prolyl cis-trans isomerase D